MITLQIPNEYVFPTWVLPTIFILLALFLFVAFVIIVRASKRKLKGLKKVEPEPDWDEIDKALYDPENPFDQYFKKKI